MQKILMTGISGLVGAGFATNLLRNIKVNFCKEPAEGFVRIIIRVRLRG